MMLPSVVSSPSWKQDKVLHIDKLKLAQSFQFP